MEIEINIMYMEKKAIVLKEIPIFNSSKKENSSRYPAIKIFHNRKINSLSKITQIIYFDKDIIPIKNLNSENIKTTSNNIFFFEINNDSKIFENEKNGESFLNSNSGNSTTTRRRRRRKFATDEERRIARILKNRRTAEESRQRRIQKMKDLENFAANFEEREKKLRDEIRHLRKQNASQAIELMLLTEKFIKNSKSISNGKSV